MHSCMVSPSLPPDWNHLRTFLAVAEHGSYSAAAKALSVAQPTIGRQVAALEEELGVALFERVGRGLHPTPSGLALVEHTRAMSEAALRVSRIAAGHSSRIEGPITLAASEIDAVYVLPPVISGLRKRYPGIVVDVIASNAAQDLSRREADVALRSFRPEEPELVARKVREDEAHLYASTKLLAKVGERPSRRAIERLPFIGFDRADTFAERLEVAFGIRPPPAAFKVVCASQHVQWALVREGLGVGIMLASVGDAEPAVRRVSAALPSVTVPTWLVTHREVRTSVRVRTVVDYLAKALGR